jgi:hypothetical protein
LIEGGNRVRDSAPFIPARPRSASIAWPYQASSEADA